MMKKRLIGLAVCLALLAALPQAMAQEITVASQGSQVGDRVIAYPQLTGMEDEAVQEKINGDIVLACSATEWMTKLFTLPKGEPLEMTYEVCLLNDQVFSTLITRRGPMERGRVTLVITALTYDLKTGERLGLDQVFRDPDAAVAEMERIAEDSLSMELSGYMEYSDLLPLPQESFTLDETGITFWYPQQQFSFFSGYPGAVQFWYEELDGMWLKQPPIALLPSETRTQIEQHVSAGTLPHIPVAMGQRIFEVNEAFRLLRQPDEFPGGRYFVMEDPRLRQVLILSDALYDGYEQSVVEGIQLKRGGLCGLLIGKTTQEQWRNALGKPEKTVQVTENMAYDYGLPVGQYDVYHYGENELRLHADEQGVLCAVQLCK